MKKTIFISITCMVVLILSCKKDMPKNEPSGQNLIRKSLIIGDSVEQVTCANYSFLKFDNKEVFLNTMILLDSLTHDTLSPLYEFEQNFSFTNLRYTINQLSDSLQSVQYSTKVSRLMATVLSVDTIVQIDTLAFLIDFADSSIYEMYPVSCANMSVLKQKQEVNNDSMYVLKYKLTDPVFHPSGYEEYSGKSFKWLKKIFNGCSDVWANKKQTVEYKTYNSTVSGSSTPFKITLSHAYLTYGIYFEISHYFQHINSSTGYSINVSLAFNYSDTWKVYCGGAGFKSVWSNFTYGSNSFLSATTYKSTNSLAINHNQTKTYIWMIPFGTAPTIASPYYHYLPDLNY